MGIKTMSKILPYKSGRCLIPAFSQSYSVTLHIRTADNMATPCSVNTKGRDEECLRFYLFPCPGMFRYHDGLLYWGAVKPSSFLSQN